MAEKIDIVSVSYALGIISIVFAFFNPLAGLVVGIIGLTQSKRNKSTKAKRLNIIGIILGVIFFILSLIALAYMGSSSGLSSILGGA